MRYTVRVKIIGHRGARLLAPENTIAGFKKALEHNVDEIECDVRITEDNVAVLIHDPYLHDPGGARLPVSKHTYEELTNHKNDLATLEEALRFVGRRVPVMIELKPREDPGPAVAVVRKLLAEGWQTTDFALVSFDFAILQELKRQLPQIELVVDEMWSGVRASRRARKLGARRINMFSWWLWSGFIRAMSRSYELSAFPLNNTRKARRWAKAGLSGVITDTPDLFR